MLQCLFPTKPLYPCFFTFRQGYLKTIIKKLLFLSYASASLQCNCVTRSYELFFRERENKQSYHHESFFISYSHHWFKRKALPLAAFNGFKIVVAYPCELIASLQKETRKVATGSQ